MGIRRAVLRLVSAIVPLGFVLALLVPGQASAAITLSGSSFNAGNIITNAAFFDDDSMTETQIQAFLDKKIGTCLSSSPYCLNVYEQDTASRPATSINGDGVNPLCDAYEGAENEPAARIIYKVQRACHISAKVILVTLQKENGLVTNKYTQPASLRTAMGMGCPDNLGGPVVCDAKYYGFFNQVYYGTSQLKRYTDPASVHYSRYAPAGRSSQIWYHETQSACGSKTVYVSNIATHALYVYTPYTPNAAALANLSGRGDSCSAYGNSNFWEYYQYWFNGKLAIQDKYQTLGQSAANSLGAEVSAANCTQLSNTCFVEYEHGIITWNYLNQYRVVSGAIVDAYLAAGGLTGPLGGPASLVGSVDGGANGVGERQVFANGYIYTNPNAQTVAISDEVYAFWVNRGGPSGSLGWPASAQVCDGDVCEQRFTGGYVMTSTTGAFQNIPASISPTIQEMGGITNAWGLPVSAPVAVNGGANGNGDKQAFAAGTVYAGPSTVQIVSLGINRSYFSLGGASSAAGWPVRPGVVNPAGDESQRFTGGVVVRTTQRVTWLVPGQIGLVYASMQGVRSYLGLPTKAQITANGANGVTGSRQDFVGGTILRGPAGTFSIPRPIWSAYARARVYKGTYGWPTAKAVLTDGVWTQTFQGGTITAPVVSP